MVFRFRSHAVPYYYHAAALLFLMSLWHLSCHPTATAFAISDAAAAAPSSPPSPTTTTTLLTNKKVCISGGGPCGLFLAMLLLRRDPTVRITILEKSQRRGGGGVVGNNNTDVNAFGIGIGSRLNRSLDAVPGLRDELASVSAPTSRGTRIISRTDLAERMTRVLEEDADDNANNRRCEVLFDEGCAGIDLERKEVTTTSSRKIPYDLLVGADGIHSGVRRTLVKERGLREAHYLEPGCWKALRMPPQPELDRFAQPRHPKHSMALLPRYPEGHILLMFFKGGTDVVNPGNLNTPEELKAMISDAFQEEQKDSKGMTAFKRTALKHTSREQEDGADSLPMRKNVVFDDNAVNVFLETRPGRSHYMKANRFHDDSVALIGDAAHGMNSLLGQGCAAGLKYTEVLAEELTTTNNRSASTTNINDALRSYTKRARPGAHAITDLNRIGATTMGGWRVLRALGVTPFVMLQKLFRRKSLFQRISDVDVPYEKILRENVLLLPLMKLQWMFERVPFRAKSTES